MKNHQLVDRLHALGVLVVTSGPHARITTAHDKRELEVILRIADDDSSCLVSGVNSIDLDPGCTDDDALVFDGCTDEEEST